MERIQSQCRPTAGSRCRSTVTSAESRCRSTVTSAGSRCCSTVTSAGREEGLDPPYGIAPPGIRAHPARCHGNMRAYRAYGNMRAYRAYGNMRAYRAYGNMLVPYLGHKRPIREVVDIAVWHCRGRYCRGGYCSAMYHIA